MADIKISRQCRPVSVDIDDSMNLRVVRDQRGEIYVKIDSKEARIPVKHIDSLCDALKAVRDEPK